MSSDESFLADFEACRWPLEQFHHREHIKLAYLYLSRHPFDDGVNRFRTTVQTYIDFHKVPVSPTSGYHETMTIAWLRLVHLTLCEYGPAASADAFYEDHPELSQKKTLRLFYSRDRFTSAEAKATFVEPDLAPLPRSRNTFQPASPL